MKTSIIMAALIAASGSAFAQDNSDSFINHHWVDLGSNHTDLAMVQRDCQALGSNYHVPTAEHMNKLPDEFRKANLYDRASLLDVVALGFGDKSRYRKYKSPDFLANYNGEPRRTSVRAYGSGVRIRAMYIVKNNLEPFIEEEFIEEKPSSDPIDMLFNDFLLTLKPQPKPIHNMCVQLPMSNPIVPETEGNAANVDELARHEFILDPLTEENNNLVEIVIGKHHQVDCNAYGLEGNVEKIETGFDYPFYKLASYSISHTLMACPAESVRKEFLTIESDKVYIYDSSKPFVVYAPKDLEVSIKTRYITR
ncbi:ecotin family protein [Shewanella sp. YLB-07]|uniref:ecotin family protein n=1 Tax=Shewanella sp. YLB-07 TaxID=2601268 RepID=UPI00128E7E8C|nr:ecotin family protein [Shewanella sp. YLB-07]MPY25347.1 hypothetical protein [Shewanella sp. YLB-07]